MYTHTHMCVCVCVCIIHIYLYIYTHTQSPGFFQRIRKVESLVQELGPVTRVEFVETSIEEFLL